MITRRRHVQRGGDKPNSIEFGQHRGHTVRFYSLLPCHEVWYIDNNEGVYSGRINYINYENKTFNIFVNNSLIDNVLPHNLLKKCGDNDSLIDQFVSNNYLRYTEKQKKKAEEANLSSGNCQVKVNLLNEKRSYFNKKDPATECRKEENNYNIEQLKFDQLKEREFLIRGNTVEALKYEGQVKVRLIEMKKTYVKCVNSTKGYISYSTPEQIESTCGPNPDEIFQKHNEELQEIDKRLIAKLNERPNIMPKVEPQPPSIYKYTLEKRSKTKRIYTVKQTPTQIRKEERRVSHEKGASKNRTRKIEFEKSHEALVERLSEPKRDREFTLLRCPQVYYLKPSGQITKAEIIDANLDGSYKISYGDKKTEVDNVRIEKLLTRCDESKEYEIDSEIKQLISEATQRLAESKKSYNECKPSAENNNCYNKKRLHLEQQYDLLNIQHRQHQIRGKTELANNVSIEIDKKHEEIQRHYNECNNISQSWLKNATSWFTKSSTNNICGIDPAKENLVESDPTVNWQEYENMYGNNYSNFRPITSKQAFANLAVHVLGLTGSLGQAYLNNPPQLPPKPILTTNDQPQPQPIATISTPALTNATLTNVSTLQSPLLQGPIPQSQLISKIQDNVTKTSSGKLKLSASTKKPTSVKNQPSVNQLSVNQTSVNQTSTQSQNESSVAQQVEELLQGMRPSSRPQQSQTQLPLSTSSIAKVTPASTSSSSLILDSPFAKTSPQKVENINPSTERTSVTKEINKNIPELPSLPKQTQLQSSQLPLSTSSPIAKDTPTSTALIVHPTITSTPPGNFVKNERTSVKEEINIPSTKTTTTIQSSPTINENELKKTIPESNVVDVIVPEKTNLSQPLEKIAVNDIAATEMPSVVTQESKDAGYITTPYGVQDDPYMYVNPTTEENQYMTIGEPTENPYLSIEETTTAEPQKPNPTYEFLPNLPNLLENQPHPPSQLTSSNSSIYNKLQPAAATKNAIPSSSAYSAFVRPPVATQPAATTVGYYGQNQSTPKYSQLASHSPEEIIEYDSNPFSLQKSNTYPKYSNRMTSEWQGETIIPLQTTSNYDVVVKQTSRRKNNQTPYKKSNININKQMASSKKNPQLNNPFHLPPSPSPSTSTSPSTSPSVSRSKRGSSPTTTITTPVPAPNYRPPPPPPKTTRSALKIYARSQVPFRHRRTLKAWNQIERRQMKSDDYRERMRQRRLTHKQRHDIKKYQFENRFNKNYNRLEWEKQRLRRPNGSYNSLQQTRRLQGYRNYQNNRYRYQNNIPSYNYNYNSNYSRRPINNNRPVYGPSYNY